MKTQKVMEVLLWGKFYVCIMDMTAKVNPYKLYEKWYDGGWHRKKLAEYGDMDSVLMHILQIHHPVLSWDVR